MKSLLFRGIPFLIILLITGCKKADTGVGVQPVKDPRTYTWTADTLGYPDNFQTLMYDIWGSSPNDVYAVGWSSGSRNAVMWHYDGNKWTNVVLLASDGGPFPFGSFTLNSIYGFSSTDIYAAGTRYGAIPNPNNIDYSFIIHYDGSAWRDLNVYNGRSVYSIFGNTPSDIWAGGREKIMSHFNGSKWETDSINISVQPDYFFGLSSIGADGSNIYAVGGSNNNNTGNTINYLFKRLNNNWVAMDSFLNINYKFGIRLNKSKLQNLYSYGGGGIFKYNGTTWNSFYQTSYPISSMWGTKENNIFATTNVRAYHYNGADWKEIEQLTSPQADYWAVWTDGTEAFVVGHINDGVAQKTIVWHGK